MLEASLAELRSGKEVFLEEILPIRIHVAFGMRYNKHLKKKHFLRFDSENQSTICIN